MRVWWRARRSSASRSRPCCNRRGSRCRCSPECGNDYRRASDAWPAPGRDPRAECCPARSAPRQRRRGALVARAVGAMPRKRVVRSSRIAPAATGSCRARTLISRRACASGIRLRLAGSAMKASTRLSARALRQPASSITHALAACAAAWICAPAGWAPAIQAASPTLAQMRMMPVMARISSRYAGTGTAPFRLHARQNSRDNILAAAQFENDGREGNVRPCPMAKVLRQSLLPAGTEWRRPFKSPPACATRSHPRNRDSANARGSTTAAHPPPDPPRAAPAPRPIPKPCPLNPARATTTSPGSASTFEITGTASGVESITPPRAAPA